MGYVDSHVHLWFREAFDQKMIEKFVSVFGSQWLNNLYTIKDAINDMDNAGIDYVVNIVYPSRYLWNSEENFVLRVINMCKEYPDKFSIVGGVQVNVLDKKQTVYWIEKQYENGVSGFKIHPPHMWFKPNDYRPEEKNLEQLEILYEFAQDHNLPVIVHTGTSYFPNARNKYSDPIFVDDVAIDFPKLRIIMAHAGRPNWVPTAFQLARIRRNIYIDLSSIPPRRVLEYIPRLEEISDKALYGSDFPDSIVKSLGENLSEFLKINISEEAKKKICELNPRKFFKTLAV